MQKNKGLWILAIYFFLSIYLLPIYPQEKGAAEESTRWAAAASLIEKSSFDVAWTREITGENQKTVKIGDAFYPALAPGAAILAAPVYAVTRIFTGAPTAANVRITWFVMRFFISTVPVVFLALWLYARETDEISLATMLFATPLFFYSLTFSPYPLVAVLLYFAFRLIYDTERIFLRNCLLAGFLSGLSVTCEFAATVPVLVFAAGLFFANRRDRWSNLFVFSLGAAPFLALLLVYNYAIFGSPLASVYGYESFSETSEASRFGYFSSPDLYNLYLPLFSPARGLFFYAPILLLSIVALFTSRERKTWRLRVKAAAIIVSTIVFSLANDWTFAAGTTVIILPLLLDSFFDGEIYEFSNLWQSFLLTISFLLCTIPALTFPFAPLEFKYPHNDFWREFLIHHNWFTPNVFGFAPSVWTILPVAVLLLVVLFLVWRYARRPQRFFIGAIAGLLLVIAYLFLPILDRAENAERRIAVIERLSGRENFSP